MTGTDWIVILGGIAAIAWVNWYFFLAQRTMVSATVGPVSRSVGGSGTGESAGKDSRATVSPIPEVTIVVNGGYSPSSIRVKARQPVRLLFDRQDTSGCSEEVVFPDFKIRQFLPTGKTTTVEITPPAAGRYEFMCGMSMLRGTLIAEE
ncbi:MAG: cupredoxin domain-containing protein [Gemmatimonadaceae bacterium]|nr:cupredoxin domain-containing protein [Gemmatimonadaceae bacterium]